MTDNYISQLTVDSKQESQMLSNESDDEVDTDDDEILTSETDNDSFSSESDVEKSDVDHFEQLYNNLFESDKHSVNDPQNDKIRFAFDSSSRSSSSVSADSIYLDDIESFFNIDGTFLQQPTSAIEISGANRNEFGLSAGRNKIFVGSISSNISTDCLKSFFNQLGYSPITDVHGPIFTENNRKPGFAFVTFESDDIAAEILYDYSVTPGKFQLNRRQLRLAKAGPRTPKKQQMEDKRYSLQSESYIFTFPLCSLMYGTLIGATAMQNIVDQHSQSEQEHTSTYGCIVHQFLNKLLKSASLKINTKERKFSIDVIPNRDTTPNHGLDGLYRFEWSFRDLKGNKITPVLTHGLSSSNLSLSDESIDPSIYFLCEIRRPPCISVVIPSNDDTPDSEIRLPGSTLIGRANAWIFQIPPELKIYEQLTDLLHKYHLCERQFQASNIVHLLKSNNRNSERLIHVDILSMNEWNEKHREAISRFRSHRWPLFPYETKFEIMKLISKHIITINDLILDERLEFVLGKMTQNTLIACIDKIFEFAHLWQPTSEKPNDEDWDDEQDDSNEVEIPESITMTYHLPKPLDSAIGTPLDPASLTTATIKLGRMKLRDLYRSGAGYFGSLTRLLCLGLDELHRKHQLHQTESGAYIMKQEMRQSKSNQMSFIRKVFITPATIHYEGPHPEEHCTVTRQFTDLQDRSIRVSFRDEDYRKLKNANKSMAVLYKHIQSILNKSLNICGRKYEFLAFSSSQLREHSCWMFSKRDIGDVSCATVRKWMGNFQDIHPVAKMAARLGQSFSTTTKGKELSEGSYHEIDDVPSPINPKALYTDGIGIIAHGFAKELSEQMNLDFIPSAFQIRFGGYKGMVCVDIANKLANDPKTGVVFRPSMKKFESENCSIDIVRTSDFSLSYLNRQIILLLSSRRIPDSVFHTIQNEMIDEVMSITNDPDCACDTLRKFNGKSGGNGTHKMMIGYLSRFGLNTERFIQQMLLCFQAFQLKQLRTKARILIKKGCVLFGVVDERKTLKYEEVFIQIHDPNENDGPRIIEGLVIVTRNPCLHPGDVRRYEAVNNPLLHDLKNVIVFPMDGPTSMAAELSGGDLDGDTFWISWDPRLLFSENYEALCHTNPTDKPDDTTASRSNESYGIADICRFFVEYIEADNLGVIATWHMALADLYGVEDKRCLDLARMHSIAVDFVKTGQRPPPLTKNLRPLMYPHFMEKKDKPDYESTSVLGQLYNEAKKFKVTVNPMRNSNKKSFPYSSLLVDGYPFYIDDARILKQEYDRELRQIMRHYGVHREGEIISGYMTKFMSKQYAKEGKMFELRNEIAHAIRTMRNKYIQIFWQEFYLSSSAVEEQEQSARIWQTVPSKLTWHNQLDLADFYKKHTIEVEQKGSAWFYVTYQEQKKNYRSMANKREQFYSFAWLVYPVLFHIYDHHRNETAADIDHRDGKRGKNKRRRQHRRENRGGH